MPFELFAGAPKKKSEVKKYTNEFMSFRAGRLLLDVNGTVRPDKEKGAILLSFNNGKIEMSWISRETNELKLKFTIHPSTAVFKKIDQCKTGRVYALYWPNDKENIHLFWMQEPKEENDIWICNQVNRLIKTGKYMPKATPSNSKKDKNMDSNEFFSIVNGLSEISDNEMKSTLDDMSAQDLMNLLTGISMLGMQAEQIQIRASKTSSATDEDCAGCTCPKTPQNSLVQSDQVDSKQIEVAFEKSMTMDMKMLTQFLTSTKYVNIWLDYDIQKQLHLKLPAETEKLLTINQVESKVRNNDLNNYIEAFVVCLKDKMFMASWFIPYGFNASSLAAIEEGSLGRLLEALERNSTTSEQSNETFKTETSEDSDKEKETYKQKKENKNDNQNNLSPKETETLRQLFEQKSHNFSTKVKQQLTLIKLSQTLRKSKNKQENEVRREDIRHETKQDVKQTCGSSKNQTADKKKKQIHKSQNDPQMDGFENANNDIHIVRPTLIVKVIFWEKMNKDASISTKRNAENLTTQSQANQKEEVSSSSKGSANETKENATKPNYKIGINNKPNRKTCVLCTDCDETSNANNHLINYSKSTLQKKSNAALIFNEINKPKWKNRNNNTKKLKWVSLRLTIAYKTPLYNSHLNRVIKGFVKILSNQKIQNYIMKHVDDTDKYFPATRNELEQIQLSKQFCDMVDVFVQALRDKQNMKNCKTMCDELQKLQQLPEPSEAMQVANIQIQNLKLESKDVIVNNLLEAIPKDELISILFSDNCLPVLQTSLGSNVKEFSQTTFDKLMKSYIHCLTNQQLEKHHLPDFLKRNIVERILNAHICCDPINPFHQDIPRAACPVIDFDGLKKCIGAEYNVYRLLTDCRLAGPGLLENGSEIRHKILKYLPSNVKITEDELVWSLNTANIMHIVTAMELAMQNKTLLESEIDEVANKIKEIDFSRSCNNSSSCSCSCSCSPSSSQSYDYTTEREL